MFNSKRTFVPVQIRSNVNRRGRVYGPALALLLFVSASLQAQDFQWAVKNGDTGDDQGFGIAADAVGNTYVTGTFSGTVTFGSTSLISAGDGDIFIAKYDASGSVVWAKRAGGTVLDQGRDIAVDAAGNVYVTGFFRGASADFGSITLTGAGGAELFVARYDASGNELWAKRAGGLLLQTGYSIAVDASGNSYITGYIQSTATFGPGETNETMLTSAGLNDMIVAKYAANGDLVWVKRAGGLLNAQGFGIDVDAVGNSYVTGSFDGTATFGPGETYETMLTSAGVNNFPDIYLAKYDPNGTLVWAKRAGDVNFDDGRGIRVDAAGNIYVTGRFQSMATFGSTSVTSAGNFDVFVAKYDASGNVIWVTRAGGTGVDEAWNIAIDATGFSYITGYFQSTANFGSTSLSSAGLEDLFAAKYDANGNLVWATRAGGTAHDEGIDVALDAARNMYFTGLFASAPAAFGALNLSSAGSNDVYVAKIASHCLIVINTNDSGPGSLRQAILDANALTNLDASTPDTIKFKIPGSGPHTIAPTSALPTIADPVIIDGYTQSGASAGALKIILNGGSAPSGTIGFIIAGGNTTVQGLVINGFSNFGIYINTAGGNSVKGNFIGTDVSGTASVSNSDGVVITSANNIVGGTTTAERNVISGNTGDGVFITLNTAAGNKVIGNYLGTDATGTLDLGNGNDGVALGSGGHNNIIGGTTAGERNIISGNNRFGIYFSGTGTTGNKIIGNYIGTDVTGTNLLGNSSDGVLLYPDGGNSVGGTGTGEGNIIAGNGRAGVDLANITTYNNNNPILGNSIFGNTGLGIDLSASLAGIAGEADGLTANDAGDPDVGANNLQNFPVMTLVQRLGNGDVSVTYSVSSADANSAYPLRIEFFLSQGGQGKTFIGAQGYAAANAQLAVTQTFTPNAGVSIGDKIVATATDANGNTSEFSAESPVSAPPLFSKQFSSASITAGGVSSLTFTIDNTANSVAAASLDFTDNLPAGVVVASPANASATCSGGTLTATDGTGVITYTSGTVSAGASCTIQIDVTSATPGSQVNTTGDLTSSLGNSGTATATLTVNAPTVSPFVFVANHLIKVDQNKTSEGDLQSNYGDIHFFTGAPGKHTGNLFAGNDITIEKKNTITGDATAGDDIYLTKGATLTGSKMRHTSITVMPLPNPSFSAGGQNKTVKKGGSLSLTPGSYGNVNVGTKGTLNLSAGTYYMNVLDLGASATIAIDVTGGEVKINIVSDLIFEKQTSVNITGGGTEKVTFATLQCSKIEIGQKSVVRGTLIAHNAEVHFDKECKFKGTVYAESITLDAKTQFYPHTSSSFFKENEEEDSPSEDYASNEQPVTSYELEQNYPNPFNPTTTISFQLPENSDVTLSIFNTNGQLVKRLVAGEMSAGHHSFTWDATDTRGERVASGVYLYILKAGEFTAQRKLLLMK